MEAKLSRISRTLTPSPIQELSHLAQRCGAINLAEGFPDFSAPPHVKEAAISAINADLNQYRHVQGICDLLAATMRQNYGLDINPLTDVVICCGQSEAFAAAIFAAINQGDEVLLFDPAYETYESCIALAGGIPVYEYITFDMQKHISIATLPGMQERTVITSSLSKTFSVTGWRIGWACAPASIASAIRSIHVKITDSAPAPFQEAAVTALQSPPAYFKFLKAEYEAKRDFVVQMLSSLGFQIRFKPQGSVFVFAELPENWLLSDLEFVTELIENAGVAAVPGCGFFHADPNVQEYRNRYVRFAFCKSEATLNAAAQKMGELCKLQRMPGSLIRKKILE
ncbi:kynurenine--oxoglutarate transaminase-like isoform X3 [Phoenix dactylifera]|uniref:Kynurenine--oxoglutarate transaminase-like isoform X3 n=1 Tax=Phoenix dactylifera TaxID=42345 RepID=A0A8B7CWA5_PHODC|nr:kynurenine--oxoglutarate transaminase-like isoform X3 [Phoenix dactylifera]